MKPGKRRWLLLALFLVPRFSLAESMPVERHLDPGLKLLYHAQMAAAASDRFTSRHTIPHERALEIVKHLRAGTSEGQQSSNLLLVLRYQGDESRLSDVGFAMQARIGTVFSGVLNVERLPDLAALPGLIYAELSLPLHGLGVGSSASVATAAESASSPTPLATPVGPAAGGGALVGLIDSGIDVHHRSFRNADGTTRIKYLLDLSNPGDLDGDGILDGPDDFGGTSYTEAQINHALASGKPLTTHDPTGHGTLALSVAAGSDQQFPGLAPGAPLIVVKATRHDGTLDFESADLLNAMKFIDEKAAELRLPYVINMSLGTAYGPHDGKSAEEVAIDELVGPGIPGKAVVVAAGNSDERLLPHFRHFQGTAFTGIDNHHSLRIPQYRVPTPGVGNDSALVDLWYEGSDRLTIRVTAPDGITMVEATYGDFADTETPFGQVFIGNLGGPDPRNGANEAVILLYDESGKAPSAGDWTITVRGEEISSTGLYHGWLVEGASLVGGVEPYLPANADNRFLIARPAAAENAIAVGSFARHDPASLFRIRWTDIKGVSHSDSVARSDDISAFSSTGPTRDGRAKPDITAPGEFVIGAVSRDAFPGNSQSSIFLQGIPSSQPYALIIKNVPDRAFGLSQGTSFSAPVVTGLVARLLTAAPSLDAVEIRNILVNSAQTDSSTGRVPNDSWGYGKANLRLAQTQSPLPSSFRINPDTLPAGVVGQQFNQAFSATGGIPPFTWMILAGGTPPPGIALTAGALLTGIPTATGRFGFTLQARDSSSPAKITNRPFLVVVASQTPLKIGTLHLPPGDLTSPYSSTLSAIGGTPPYAWSLLAGQLPPGVTLAPQGILAGGPLQKGQFFFTVLVSDAAGATALGSLRIDVIDASKLAWQPVGLEDQFVRLIALDPRDANHLVVGVSTTSRRYSLFDSFDSGRIWTRISLHTGLPFEVASNLRIDPVTSKLWALTDFDNMPYRFDRTLHQWQPMLACNSLTQLVYTRMIDVGFDTAGSIFLLPYFTDCPLLPSLDAFRGFLRSTNGGITWQNIGHFPNPGIPDVPSTREQLGRLSVYAADPHHLYASWSQEWNCCSEPVVERMFRSDDGGASWIELAINIPTLSTPYVSQADPYDIVRAPWNPDDYAAFSRVPWTPDYPGSSILERSTDGGVAWTASEIPGRLRLCRLERSVSQPSVLIAGTIGGVYKSEDSGTNWKALSLPGTIPNLCEGGALAIDPHDPQKLYVGLKNARIAISSDGGNSWRIGGQHLLERRTSGLALSAARPTDLLVVSGAPFVSRSSGERWTLSASGVNDAFIKLDGSSFPIISEADPDTFFFVAQSGFDIYRSHNRGVSWEKLRPAFGQATTISPEESYQPSICSLIADPFDANVLIARVLIYKTIQDNFSEFEGMWKSEDAGATWKMISEPEVSIFYSDAQAPSIAFAHDIKGHLFAGGLTFLYESVNWGASWTAVSPLRNTSISSIRVLRPAPSDPHYLYVIDGASVGAYDARTGVWSWNDSPYYSFFSSLAVDPRDRLIAYLGRTYALYEDTSVHNANNDTGGIDKTTDGGRTWTRLASFPKSLSVISLEADTVTPGVVYAATLEDGVYKTQDSGATWTKLDSYGVLADVVNVALKDPVNPNLLFVGTQGFGVQMSADGGQSFAPRIKGLTNLNVTSLAFDPGSPEILYAGTENGLFKTTDSGNSWVPTALAGGLVTDISVDSGSRPRKIRITTFQYGVVISSDQGRTVSYHTTGLASLDLTSIAEERRSGAKRLWVGMRGGDGVAISDDLGATWKAAVGSGLANRYVNQVVIEPGMQRIWIATDGGIAVTEDEGATWKDASTGLPQGVPVTSLSFNPDTHELLASLFDPSVGGVYRGGNTAGTWTSFGQDLEERRVRRLSNDGGHTVNGNSRSTSFYASTAGAGLFVVDIPSEGGSPLVSTNGLPNARVDAHYQQQISATGGLQPYTWLVVDGVLPLGLALDGRTGLIAGTPITAGLFTFIVQVADANGAAAQKGLTLLVRKLSGSR